MQSYAGGDYGPTDQSLQVMAVLSAELDEQLNKLKQALTVDLPALNGKLKQAGLPPVPPSFDRKAPGGN